MSDRYRRVKVIGKGSFGSAVLVRHRQTQKHYIIKEINVAQLSRKEKAEALTEIRVLSQLNHPHIVHYCESFIAEGKLCIVMDYCEKGDLYTLIQQRRGLHFKEDQIWDWFIQLCLAIKHVHDRKILHRDIKTQNVFLSQDNSVQLGDFGIARVLKSTMECAKTAIGTPYYLSPEICEDKPYNNKSDIWSMGCVLYEITTLRHAFDANNMKGLVLKILRGVYPPIPAHYSNELRSLISMMFARDPRQRPSINAILRLPHIHSRVQRLLSKSVIQSEFAHTVLHNRPSPAMNAELPPDVEKLDGQAALRRPVVKQEVPAIPRAPRPVEPVKAEPPRPAPARIYRPPERVTPVEPPRQDPVRVEPPKPFKAPERVSPTDISVEQRRLAFLEQKAAAERNRRNVLIDRGIIPADVPPHQPQAQPQGQPRVVSPSAVNSPPLSPRERARRILDNIEKERQERHNRLKELQDKNNAFLEKKREEMEARRKNLAQESSPFAVGEDKISNNNNDRELALKTLHQDLVKITENNEKQIEDPDSEYIEDKNDSSSEDEEKNEEGGEREAGFRKWLLKQEELKVALQRFKNFQRETINLPDIKVARDSLAFRIECLQLYLEQSLGLDVLLASHRRLGSFIDDSNDDNDDEIFNKEISNIMGEKVHFLTLVQQLIYCQHKMNSEF
ncbi:hypothetical protein RCL1_002983 [Eukaryota sp. TZLM3-RCL]